MSNAVAAHIKNIPDWRGPTFARLRALILEAAPGVSEDMKWKKPTNPAGVAAWDLGGLICTGEIYKDKVKITFPKGSALDDPKELFNASLEGVRRAIDILEGEKIDEKAFKALIKAALALNAAKPAKAQKKPKSG
jgi:hypothetical protein